ncbi:MAG: glycine--tRNA ligase subunit beta, partial [Alphaproteobacteria bacterium]|nr:glycine--tRNA ligase subunit beta [Alphaproteobacteria bacterium]
MDILIELQMEEVPARMQGMAEKTFKSMFDAFCLDHDIKAESVRILSTPRRLALIATGLPKEQANQVIERKGPRTDAPQQALDGFFQSVGLTPNQCSQLETPKGTFWIANIEKKGQPLSELIKAFIEDVLTSFPWPKTMRWGTVPFRWVRPLHRILMLVDNTPMTGQILSIPLVNTTIGHRFLGQPNSSAINSITEYEAFLKANYVMADRSIRKQTILDQVTRVAQKLDVFWNEDQGLLDEVTGLVEYPIVLEGTIDAEFMGLPKELMISVMRTHQRYFTFSNKGGALAPYFGIVANNLTSDTDGKIVRHGNEKVLRARLSDGQFYWETDKNTPLETFAEKLETIVFHQRLGTLKDKRKRIAHAARFLNQWVGLPQDSLREAADLCKADLVSGVVGEFPELQGIMGGYYALHQGKASIAKAMTDHYKPLGPNDSLPRDLMGIVVALVDKLDTLVGFFAIDEKPTGSKDPFALRRAALGILRLLFAAHEEHGKDINVSLDTLVRNLLTEYQNVNGLNFEIDSVVIDVVTFFTERLKVSLKETGYRYDVIDAILGSRQNCTLIQIKLRLDVLSEFMSIGKSADLLSGYNRLWNILKSQKLLPTDLDIDPTLLREEAEQTLYKEWKKRSIENLIATQQYETALISFTEMKPFIDRFFDSVMVNDQDDILRQNRLALLVA